MEPRADPDSSENLKEVERRYDEREKRLIGKHDVAAHEESEVLERRQQLTMKQKIFEQHTMKTADADDETGIFEQQHLTRATVAAKDAAEVLEQKHAATTAAITNG